MEHFGEDYYLDENIELDDEYFTYSENVDMMHQQQQLVAQQQQQHKLSQEFQKQQQQLKDYYEKRAAQDAKKLSEMEAQLKEAMQRYHEAQAEIGRLNTVISRRNDDSGARDKIKQLEERVTLIKTKAKEKIEEKDATIAELNEKIKGCQEMLSILEFNCKEAVVKFNDFQQQLEQKEEIVQKHNIFKNRYDYTINYLHEKCRFITDKYEKKLKALEQKLQTSSLNNPLPVTAHPGADLKTPGVITSEHPSPPADEKQSELAKPPADCVNLLEEDETKFSETARNETSDETKVTLGEAIDQLVSATIPMDEGN